ncbi:hypothetical protein BDV33DRAFT_210517 [Aspergillus novoparasiticus]|uniref:Uncharacterized protein n=1 Tax=Aspergillus novoparasiticus TaxID=986946 RepID=A0A5N6E6B3_9EURO|nr:hypothetical protein BDV33DRAFT_210517 [Aspergillus novoparasiticus]
MRQKSHELQTIDNEFTRRGKNRKDIKKENATFRNYVFLHENLGPGAIALLGYLSPDVYVMNLPAVLR